MNLVLACLLWASVLSAPVADNHRQLGKGRGGRNRDDDPQELQLGSVCVVTPLGVRRRAAPFGFPDCQLLRAVRAASLTLSAPVNRSGTTRAKRR